MSSRVLIYAASDARALRVVRAVVAAGLEPVLAGPDGDAVAAMAGSLGFEHRVFDLADPRLVSAGVSGLGTLVNPLPDPAAAATLAQACLDMRVGYLDMIDDVEHLEGLARLDDAARRRGVRLLPGLSWPTVVADLLAAALVRRLPHPSHLELALTADADALAPGLQRCLRQGGLVRSEGRLKRVPAGSPRRRLDPGSGAFVTCSALPLGLLATTWRSGRVANVISYGVLPPAVQLALRLGRRAPALGRLLARGRSWTRWGRAAAPPQLVVWGEVRDDAGRVARSRVCALPAEDRAARGVVLALAAIAAGRVAAGFHSPATAIGAAALQRETGLSHDELPLAPLVDGPLPHGSEAPGQPA